jgi:hypothetical protein
VPATQHEGRNAEFEAACKAVRGQVRESFLSRLSAGSKPVHRLSVTPIRYAGSLIFLQIADFQVKMTSPIYEFPVCGGGLQLTSDEEPTFDEDEAARKMFH